MGLISGYPVGSKIAINFRKNNICTKEECERLIAFTNNSGPLFIIGTVGISFFGNSTIGILLLITHILSSFTVGFLFRFWKSSKSSSYEYKNASPYENKLQTITFSNLGEVLGESISSATSTILMIGGFVVLFSVIISILNASRINECFSFAF
jgi:sporulation integral membrane protein YlbJ